MIMMMMMMMMMITIVLAVIITIYHLYSAHIINTGRFLAEIFVYSKANNCYIKINTFKITNRINKHRIYYLACIHGVSFEISLNW